MRKLKCRGLKAYRHCDCIVIEMPQGPPSLKFDFLESSECPTEISFHESQWAKILDQLNSKGELDHVDKLLDVVAAAEKLINNRSRHDKHTKRLAETLKALDYEQKR